MAITANAITGPHTLVMRYFALEMGLNAEKRSNGRMQITRGPSCKARVVAEFAGEKELLLRLGIKLNRQTSYDDLLKIVQAKKEAVLAAADAIEAAQV